MVERIDEFTRWVRSILDDDFTPHAWQVQLALDPTCSDRLIRIPTGFGKTLGVLLAWAFNRLQRHDEDWPRRLVWCLPMRVLVEQTEAEVAAVLDRLGILFRPGGERRGKVAVHRLLGGAGSADYHLWPEECAVVVGTQDMLLSRALNRGYAAPRARWPMEFGLLNQDALWVLDEVQLMDVGLATSAQLQAYRREDGAKAIDETRHCRSWWMSATLQPNWLNSGDTTNMLAALPPAIQIPEAEQAGGLWGVTKGLEVLPVDSDKDFAHDVARLASERHDAGQLTLVILNRVEFATAVFAQLETLGVDAELRLVHSRFRAQERNAWREDFLSRAAAIPPKGRIVVATQVVEAGVDISAKTLITDLAPWSSLIQRFGRCARYVGEKGQVIVLDRHWNDAKDHSRALPYEVSDLLESRAQLAGLSDVAPRTLEAFEQRISPETRQRLYPYKPKHLLLRREWIELFDTTPDLSGADIDVGRFIRSGDELDLHVFWRTIPEAGPPVDWKPARDEICAVPFRKAQEWLCGKETKEKRAPRLKTGMRAWVWDWLDGAWKPNTQRSDLSPGRILLVDAACGGYSESFGWDPVAGAVPPVATSTEAAPEDLADDAQDSENLSLTSWKTIGTHGREAAEIMRTIASGLGIANGMKELLALAAELHDWGKCSPHFQGSIRHSEKPGRDDLAKAPRDAWPRSSLYCASDGERRPGYRHELASALALFDILRRCAPNHPALLGEHAELLGVDTTQHEKFPAVGSWERRVIALPDRLAFDLVAYLIAAHHGKVRLSLHASPVDQEYIQRKEDARGLPIRGIREGDALPELHGADEVALAGRRTLSLEPAQLGLSDVTGPSWSERTMTLLEQFGPARLAWLEALIRAADIRASQLTTIDPVLKPEVSL